MPHDAKRIINLINYRQHCRREAGPKADERVRESPSRQEKLMLKVRTWIPNGKQDELRSWGKA